MSLLVYTSTVSDGSMYNRKNHTDAKVIQNRRTFLSKQGLSIEQTTRLNPNANQRAEVDLETDWCRYATLSEADKGVGMLDGNAPGLDGIVTMYPDHVLLLPVADCVGAVFYDPFHQALGVAHLGRHSLEQQGGVHFVEYFKTHFNSNPADIKVWLTPAPGQDVYPIWALDNKGMKEITFEQLAAAGIDPNNISDNPAETDKDLTYYSYSEYLKGNRDEDGDYAIIAVMPA